MGDSVGLSVGDFVGLFVGDLVGLVVGLCVGGVGVGDSVAVPVDEPDPELGGVSEALAPSVALALGGGRL